MALQINAEFETPQGIVVSSTYWRWVGLGVDVPASTLRCVLYAYASAQAFAAGKQSIGKREYTLQAQQFGEIVLAPPDGQTLSDVLSNAVYAYVKAHDPYFAAAQDV